MSQYLNDNHRSLADSFQSPSSLYRGAPFWSWNGKLEKNELLRQLDVFREMGIGGAMIHPRTGLTTEYLGDTFMDLVKACREHAHANGMLTWLYDEDRWPSGFAGGIVTKDPAYRKRHLLFTPTPYLGQAGTSHNDSTAAGRRQENGTLLARYAIRIADNKLATYQILPADEMPQTDATIWYAYLEIDPDSTWFNNQSYVDTLNPAAMQRFIEVTHERYKTTIGDAFGKDVPAIFTDEPQFTHKQMLSFAAGQQDVILPWTDALEEDFTQQFGTSLLQHLPEVIWDLPDDEPSIWRYRYHEWIAERFAASFADQIGTWCKAHNIALTGHMMEEPTLDSQCKALGEAMRSYRSMQIPGIDMLCDWMEFTTAKQAQSAARQFGCPGVLSELYGVTGWHFDFQGHKRQGDWQAALGVLFRVHHLSWYCMRGEAKRDYPASISYQSPWYKEYPTIEDHFARVGAILSRGTPVCRVGVIHPIESFWLAFGPNDTSAAERARLDSQFSNLTDWLLQSTIDFDFIAESLLPAQACKTGNATLGVGRMQYEVVVVPGMRTIRSTTLQRLEAFADAGGRIIFAGEIPRFVDVQPSSRATNLAQRGETVPFEREPLTRALARHRDIRFQTAAGKTVSSLLYQMRAEGADRYLFVCNTNHDMFIGTASGTLVMTGAYKLTELQTSTGDLVPLAASYGNGQTHLAVEIPASGHLLLKLEPGERQEGQSLLPAAKEEAGRLASPVPVTLDEPNVLLFDKATFAVNGGEWMPETQILDIENILRQQTGLPRKQGQIAQPWIDQSPPVELAQIALRATFQSDIAVAHPSLALENIHESKVIFDGTPADMQATGYYTDKAIATVALPAFAAGTHTIEIQVTFTKETSLEWFYLLGDFGVKIAGTHGRLIEPVHELSFGNWTQQGLPFYGGNVTYHCTAPSSGTSIQIPQYKATTIKVQSEGQSRNIYRPPYTADLAIQAGAPVDITLFGHRANAFGPVHLAEPGMKWLGPGAYRTTRHLFSPEYNLHPLGIFSAPIIHNAGNPAK